MKKYSALRATVALVIVIALGLNGTALGGGKKGRKYFREGARYESAEQWELAAQQYALAVADEPDNAEYRLRLLRARQQASLMYTARGDVLEAAGDHAAAYSAYDKSFAHDPTNETARRKMAALVEQQHDQAGTGEPASGGRLQPASYTGEQRRAKDGEMAQMVEFKEGASLRMVISSLARQLNLDVVFDDSFKDTTKFSLSLHNTTLAGALDVLLLQTHHVFEQVNRRTIMIFPDNPINRQRLEKLLVRTFYLNNADLNEARAIVQGMIGGQRQIVTSKQLNALVVRASASELMMVQALLDSLDKNRPEVILDVDIYEVSHSAALELGNQLATSGQKTTKTTYDKDGKPVTVDTGISASLSSLGGLGQAGVSAISGNTFTLGGGLGTIIGLPPSGLSLLQSKGVSKLLANTQIHALDGESNQTVVGRSVPIRIGSNYGTGGQTGNSNNNGSLFDNIQYKDVGLVIDVTPTITNEGYVQVKMKLESSNVEASATDSTLTPSFTKRSLTTISRVQDGVTAMVASVRQDSKGDSRASIPYVGMVPILGRFFSTPRQSSSQSDIIITVTPHIIRSTGIRPQDHLARQSGTQQSGITQNISDLILRAETEEEQERRVIARQNLTGGDDARNANPATNIGAIPPAGTESPVKTSELSASRDKSEPRVEIIPVSQPSDARRPAAAQKKADARPEPGEAGKEPKP